MEELRAVFKLTGPDLDQDEIVVGRQGLRAGRSSDNTLVLNHREISRQHFRITWSDDDRFLVEDLNSSNGVILNDTRIVARVPTQINQGDVLIVGPFTLTFEKFITASVALPTRQVIEDDREILPPAKATVNFPPGIPRDRSTWLQYLPGIYSDDEFIGRYLLIFESIMRPIIWMIDNFDMFLSPEVAPTTWLQWMSSWFDLLLLPELPEERQRRVVEQIGWLFLRRGTPAGLERLLELYFGVKPEIIEDDICHFTVRLPLSESDSPLGREVADRLIQSQKPAFAAYTLEVT